VRVVCHACDVAGRGQKACLAIYNDLGNTAHIRCG
jgi:hypothetical protein